MKRFPPPVGNEELSRYVEHAFADPATSPPGLQLHQTALTVNARTHRPTARTVSRTSWTSLFGIGSSALSVGGFLRLAEGDPKKPREGEPGRRQQPQQANKVARGFQQQIDASRVYHGRRTNGGGTSMRRGRKQRHDNPPVASAVRPGMTGGRYKPLTEREIERIHQTALDVLENIGMGDPIPILQECALAKGCKINEHGRLCFSRALVEDVIAHAGRATAWYGRDPRHDLDLSGTRVHTYGGGEAVNVLEVGAEHYRPSTILDVYDFSRLVDQLEHVHAYSRLVVATELSDDLLVCDINTAYASVAGTAKHTSLTFADAKHVEPTLEMLHLVAGGAKRFAERPFCHAGGCPIISPLRYGDDNSEVCVEATKFGSPVWVVMAPQAGATAPAALAGTLVQVIAETLAALLLVDLVTPQYPVILGPWPFVSDLRTGAFTGGSGEEAILSAASAQIINHYDLVSSVGAGMTDAKSPDNQAGYEKGITVALAALAGCNNVSESAGMVGSQPISARS